MTSSQEHSDKGTAQAAPSLGRWPTQEVPADCHHIPCAKYPDPLDYHDAISGKDRHVFGSLGYQWDDKPHRLVYALTAQVAELRDEITALSQASGGER